MIYDKIANLNKYCKSIPEADKIIDTLKNINKLESGTNIIIPDRLRANLIEFVCQKDKNIYEAHKKHIDVQCVLEGEEKIYFLSDAVEYTNEYDEANDCEFFSDIKYTSGVILNPGDFVVFFPGELHSAGNLVNENSGFVKKVVFKIKNDFEYKKQ